MRAKVQAVLFDYGLVLTGPADPEAWARMRVVTDADEARFGESYWAFRLPYDQGTITGQGYWRAVGERLGLSLSDAQLGELLELDTCLWTQVNRPMADWALRLQAANTRTGILSNLGDHIMEGVLRRLPWMHAFDHSTFSHTLRITKPDLAIYRHAADGLGVPPAHILFVDDREENIRGAEAAGMQAVRYGEQAAFEAELARRDLQPLWLSGRDDA